MNQDKTKEELADIFVHAIMLAGKHNLNKGDIGRSKIEKNHAKYPIDKAKDSPNKYTKL